MTTDAPILVIVRGLPGSGKTTFAKTLADWADNVVLISRDDLRDLMFGKRVGLSVQDEDLVTKQQDSLVRNALRNKRNVVIHDTNLRPKYVNRFIDIAAQTGAEVKIIEMPTDVERAISWDSRREAPVGEKVIRDMAKRFLPKGEYLPLKDVQAADKRDPYVPDWSKPKAAIFDLDGTLCGNTGRGWYDHDLYHTDSLRTHIGTLANLLYEDGFRILFVSGRKRSGYESTMKMLSKALPTIWADPLTQIFMRPTEDDRDDALVKYQLFDENIRDNYNVWYVFDDRDRVVNMWRSIGLNTLQVADGAF